MEYTDGTIEILTANVIAENILSQVDEEGHRQLLLHDILDHKKTDDALGNEDAYVTTKYGSKRRIKTTRGWQLCVEWKGGTTDWISLKDLKNAYPVQVAEYAIRNKIDKEPAFAWWVPYTLRKQKRILSKIKSKY